MVVNRPTSRWHATPLSWESLLAMPEERIQDRGVKRRWLSAIMSRLQLTTAFGAFVVCVAIANVCLLLENRMLETRLASIESRDT
jgi:hypothetical protein